MAEPSPRRKRLRRIFLVLAVLLALVPVAVFLALRSPGFRQSVLRQIAGWLRTEYGLVLKARDFDVRWDGFALDGVEVGAPDAKPVLRAGRVDVSMDMGTLRGPVRVIRNLEIDDPVLDLSAPIPKLPESDPQAPPGFSITRMVLRRGSVVGPPPEPPLSDQVRSWRIDEVEGGGSYVAGTWDVSIESSRARVERPGFPLLELQVGANVTSREGEPVSIAWVRATGDGLRLTGSGSIAMEAGASSRAMFDVQVEPRLLVAGAPPGGSVRAKGELWLPDPVQGRVAVTARGVPAEVLRPYVDAALFRDLSLAGTVADAEADLQLSPEAEGKGKVTWRKGGRQLVRMDLGVKEDQAIRLTAEGDLLPGSPGRRHVRGTVTAANWAELAKGTAEGIDAELRIPDLSRAVAEVRAIWPRLVPALPEIQGALDADVRLSGVLASPAADVDALWVPEPGARVKVRAEGRVATWTGSARVEMENLPIALLGLSSDVGEGLAPSRAGEATQATAAADSGASLPPGRGQAPPLQTEAEAGRLSGTFSLSGSPRSYRTTVDAEVTQAAYRPYLESLERGRITGEGSLALQPLTYTGTLDLDGTGLFARPNASSTARLASFSVKSDGALRLDPLSYQGKMSLAGTHLDIPEIARVDRANLDAEGTFCMSKSPPLPGRMGRAAGPVRDRERGPGGEGSVHLTAAGVEIPAAGVTLLDLQAEASTDGKDVRIATLTGSLPEGRTFAASGGFAVDLKTADLDLHLVRPVDPVREAELTATLRNGIVELSAPRIDTDAGPASLRATVPLEVLKRSPGEISIHVEAPAVDSESLLKALGMEARPERLRAGVTADLTFDPMAPAAGRGEVLVEGLTLETKDGQVAAEAPVIARLERGRLELQPVRLRVESAEIGATAVDVKVTADLDPAWKPGQDPKALVRSLSAEAGGTLDAALLNPFLEGGIASGAITFSGSASGTPDRLEATLAASGPEASFWWPAAAARIEGPAVIGSWSGETWKASGNAGLNGGTLAFQARPVQEGALVSLNLEDVPYRLDYGLTTRVDGVLALHVPLPLTDEARLRLDGTLDVERGLLVRDINLDREVLTLLFAPEDAPGAEETLAGRIDLDLNVTTEDGIRVRNNVADLKAHWTRLQVGGTAEVPEIRGRVEIDPGGRAELYSQTVRIDRGSLIFTGNPLQDPLVDLATTSRLEDRTIVPLAGRPLDVFDQLGSEADEGPKVGVLDQPEAETDEGPQRSDVVASGLAGYYGARVVSRLGESIGLSRLSVRPVLVFGETDPTARLTVGSDLSPNASFAVSVDMRNPESRLWLLDFHGFRDLPGMTFAAFTRENSVEGLSVQQTLDLGGSREVQEKTDRLRRLRLEMPPGLSWWARRGLKRAVGLSRKDPVPREAPFEIEVDLAEDLRRRGFPGALVTAETVPVEGRPGWVDLDVKVAELGPRVEITFAGDKPPRAFRPEIRAAYRADFYEGRSLEEMKEAAVRAFRSAGHLDPQVEIEVRREPEGRRTVVVGSDAGPRFGLEELEIAGVDPEVSRLAAGSFPGRLSRAELAAAVPAADRRLLEALKNLGYPQARIAGREVAGDQTERLTVRVEPGPRQELGDVEIAGVEEAERERLAALVPLRPGEGFRADLISAGVLRLEDSLRSRGYPDATVRAVTRAQEALAVGVRYEIEPGPRVRVAGVEIEGERWTRPAQLARLSGLEPGEPLDRNAVTDAQGRLYRTGVFFRVAARVDRVEADEALVTFKVAESPRFHLGYGVRWESDSGTAAIVDAVDTNFLRRGLTLGFRALYEPDDRRGRVFLKTGGLLGTGVSLEVYGSSRRERIEDELGDLQRDTDESSIQFARPFGRRTTGRLYLRYRTVHLVEVEPDPFFPFELELRRPYMGTQVLYDRRDDLVDPASGLFRSLDLSGSGPFVGSDFHWARLYGQVQGYRTFRLTGRPVVWAQSVQAGLIQAYSGQDLISDDRFMAGGEYSVRGYETRSLQFEERDHAEETLLVLNQELRFPLPFFEDLAGLVFFDAGQVWEGLGAFDTDLAKSLGFGFRMKSPVGLLRLDLAFPLDRRPGDDSYELYLGLGNVF